MEGVKGDEGGGGEGEGFEMGVEELVKAIDVGCWFRDVEGALVG